MTQSEIQKGDEVSWNWGSGKPSGTVAEVKEKGEIAIESNRGNTIKKNASPDNPAVHVERSGNDVIKRANELNIEDKADSANGQSNGHSKDHEKPAEPEKEDQDDEEMKDAPPSEEENEEPKQNGESETEASKDKPKEDSKDADEEEIKDDDKENSKDDDKENSQDDKENSKDDDKENSKHESTDGDKNDDKAEEPQPGDKRKAEKTLAENTNGKHADKDAPPAKKAKEDGVDGETETKPRKAGRPKASEKKEKKEPAKKKEPKKAATADGQPRRSGRNKA
ncbi:hypothetical protein ACEQ8H_007847 [Pleosporales sp. CAS-2024a]